MSIAMPVQIIKKVLDKFDQDCDVKINKYTLGYRSPGYKWSFLGKIKGEDARLTLYKQQDGQYALKKTEIKVIEEFMQKTTKIESEEEL